MDCALCDKLSVGGAKMKYLFKEKTEYGAYNPIQTVGFSELPENCALWPDALDDADFYEYSGFVTLTIEDVDGVPAVTGYEPNIEAWEAWKAGQPDPLTRNKELRIQESKTDLADYLESHPLQWTDGEYYSITSEKQQQLISKIMSATMAQTLSVDYRLTWNSTGQVCKEWDLKDLTALAFSIDARVTALVTYQQTQEVAMRDATTQDELDAIIVNYDSVA